MNAYELQQQEKARVLASIEKELNKKGLTFEKVEKSIKKQIKKNMEKNKNQFFQLGDLLNIKEIEKWFKILIITGDRNIGKTYQMMEYSIKKYKDEGKRFIWVRSIGETAQSVMTRNAKRFEQEGWLIHKQDAEVFVPNKPEIIEKVKRNGEIELIEKKPKIMKQDTAGFFIGLKNQKGKKSLEYGKVGTIIVDEFNDGIKIKDKFNQLASFVSTAMRFNDGKIIMSANYIDQGDNILATLGMKQVKGKAPMLTFNWIAGAVIWNIPSKFYQKVGSKDTLGRRLQLAGGVRGFGSQYLGEFANNITNNLKELGKFTNKQDTHYLLLGYHKLVLGQSKTTGELYITDWEKRPQQKLKQLVFNENDKMRHKEGEIIPTGLFNMLKKMWKEERLFTDEIDTAELLIEVFSGVVKNERQTIKYIK